MTLEIYTNPFPHVVIYDYFNENELKRVWKELDFLTYEDKLLGPSQTSAATSMDGRILKKNSALFLDQVYSNKDISDILKFSRKLYDLEDTKKIIYEHSWEFRPWKDNISGFNTLVSYYENSDYYEPHHDVGYYTVLIHLYKEPQQFTGGELYFPEFDFTLGNVSNRLFIFPCQLLHQVTPINMTGEKYSGNGRYTITHFTHSK